MVDAPYSAAVGVVKRQLREGLNPQVASTCGRGLPGPRASCTTVWNLWPRRFVANYPFPRVAEARAAKGSLGSWGRTWLSTWGPRTRSSTFGAPESVLIATTTRPSG